MDNKALIRYLEQDWMTRELDEVDISILFDAYSIEEVDAQSRVPFIVLKSCESFLKISNFLKAIDLQPSWVQVNRKAETELHFDEFEEFNDAWALLETKNCKYNIFTISDKNPLEVIIRGLPLSLGIEKVKNALKEKGFHILKITRCLGEDKAPTTSVEVHLREFQSKNIFALTELLGISRISVEAYETGIIIEKLNDYTGDNSLLLESLKMLRHIKNMSYKS